MKIETKSLGPWDSYPRRVVRRNPNKLVRNTTRSNNFHPHSTAEGRKFLSINLPQRPFEQKEQKPWFSVTDSKERKKKNKSEFFFFFWENRTKYSQPDSKQSRPGHLPPSAVVSIKKVAASSLRFSLPAVAKLLCDLVSRVFLFLFFFSVAYCCSLV